MPRFTQEQRAARRKIAAEMMAAGSSLAEIGRTLGMTKERAGEACVEHGVPIRRQKPRNYETTTIGILAMLFDCDLAMTQIADRCGTSLTSVSRVYTEARRLGIPGLPVRGPGRFPRKRAVSDE